MKLIRKSTNGQITFCQRANIFHMEFGNMLINLTFEELKKMHDYISSIDHPYFLKKNQETFNRRKLLLNIGSQKIFFCVNGPEFVELKNLLSMKQSPTLLENSSLTQEGIVYN